jgi:hypothetical protein
MNVGATLLIKNPAACQEFPEVLFWLAEGTGGTRCPQRVGKSNCGLLPITCASGDSVTIAFGEVDPPQSKELASCHARNASRSDPGRASQVLVYFVTLLTF